MISANSRLEYYLVWSGILCGALPYWYLTLFPSWLYIPWFLQVAIIVNNTLKVYMRTGEGENQSNRFFKVLAIELVKSHVMTSTELTEENRFHIKLVYISILLHSCYLKAEEKVLWDGVPLHIYFNVFLLSNCRLPSPAPRTSQVTV